MEAIKIRDIIIKANTGLDAIKRAPIVAFDSGIKCLRIQDVSQTKKFDDWGFCDVTEGNYSRFCLKANDILIARTGETVGVNIFIHKDLKSVFNNGLIKIKVDEKKVIPLYFFYNFRTNRFKGYINSISRGTSTQPNMQIDSLLGYEILLPTLHEQQSIASILSSLDNKIDLLRRQNQTLEQLAQTIFKQWFVDSENEDWETAKLSDYAFINQRTVDKNYPYQEIQYLDTGSITEGVIESFQPFNLEDAPSRAQRLVKQNDIVYSLVRPIQRHYGLLKEVKPNTVVSTGFAVITCNGIDPHFIYLLLTQDRQTEYFETVANNSTSTYPCLKPSDIANLEFNVPPKDLLNKFSGFASSTWNKISLNQKEIQTLTQLRDSLLPRLMSGRLRVG